MDKPRSFNRRVWLIAIGLLLAWCVYLAFFNPLNRLAGPLAAPDLVDPGLGPADLRWPLANLEGRPLNLQDYKGKTIFLNQWATWCPPCVREIPSIERLAANERLKNVVFLAISGEDTATVRQFARDHHLRIPVFCALESSPAAFQSDGIPATFVIAPSGRIVLREVGAAQWDDPGVVDLLEKLSRPASP